MFILLFQHIFNENWIAGVFFFYLKEPDEDANPSVVKDYQKGSLPNKEDEKDLPESEISDVEKQGYCDDSSSHNIDLKMKMERVRNKKLRKRYENIDKVGINTSLTIHYILQLNAVLGFMFFFAYKTIKCKIFIFLDLSDDQQCSR